MYFVFALIALLCWSGSDLFSKLGTNQKDKYSHWKVIFFVGLIMGLHALITIVISPFLGEIDTSSWWVNVIYTDFTLSDFVKYLPVAFIYLTAMVVGYVGLRYIELSVSSPICNSSGSLAFVICVLIGCAGLSDMTKNELIFTIIGVVFITVGIIGLSFVDYKEDPEAKLIRQEKSNFKYTKSFIAVLIPILYLIIDALGTVGDQVIAEFEIFEISEYSANTSFELTSLIFSLFAFIYVKLIKKEKFLTLSNNKFLLLGGTCETLGQIFYMAVMFSDFKAGIPMISAYCVVSVLWSRIFLKEKLSPLHYLMIAVTFVGIILLGIFSPV